MRGVFLFLAVMALAPSASNGDEAFRSGWLEGGAALCVPLFELSDAWKPVAGFRASAQFQYWQDWRSMLSLAYVRMDGNDAPYSAHHVLGSAGLTWDPDFPVEIGGGVSLFFARADEIYQQGDWMLADNESEFGGWLRLAVPFRHLWERWELVLWSEYQAAMTEPHSSRFLWAGASARWKAW